MNKAKYVDKMTDLVESTLERKGVSEEFTIIDNYDEDDEMSMTLQCDDTGREVTFQLQASYDRKKEGDVKVKDQYNDEIKAQVEAFVDRELNAMRENEARLAETPFDSPGHHDEEGEEEDYEDDYEDDDDYEDYDDYEDEEAFEDHEQSDESLPAPAPVEEHISPQEDVRQPEAVSSAITGLFRPIEFVNVDGAGSVRAAVIPPSMRSKTPEEIASRYKDQISALYDGGAVVAHPNASDIVVFDMGVYSKDEVSEMIPDMLEEGGTSELVALESDKSEPELP